MSAFSQVVSARDRAPQRVVSLPPTAWADGEAGKPTEPVPVGLRLLSEADVQTARAEAAKLALELHDDVDGQVQAFNDALMRWAVARGTCTPEDRTVAFFDMDENGVREALTSDGVRWLFTELERLTMEVSPIHREATDDDVAALCGRLGDGAIARLHPGAATRVRKYLRLCLDELSQQ